ncbi:MAG: hypothetical protein ACLPND_24710 [Candidatus Korobacteraceae bacterium]
MTRKKKKSTSSLRLNARPGGYTEWLQSFEANEGVPALMERLAGKGVDVKRVRTLLYAAPLLSSIKCRRDLDKLDENLATVQRHVDGATNLLKSYPFSPQERSLTLGILGWVRRRTEKHRHRLAEWRSAFTTIQMTDLTIAMIAQDLKHAGSRRVNEELATLLTAAAVPGGTRDRFTKGWAWDAATINKRRVRLKRNPFAALGPYRSLFENVNIEKLAKKYPSMFIHGGGKRTREPKTFGQKIAASADLLPPFESPAPQETFWETLREEFSKASR